MRISGRWNGWIVGSSVFKVDNASCCFGSAKDKKKTKISLHFWFSIKSSIVLYPYDLIKGKKISSLKRDSPNFSTHEPKKDLKPQK
jgi:hypothetical protein